MAPQQRDRKAVARERWQQPARAGSSERAELPVPRRLLAEEVSGRNMPVEAEAPARKPRAFRHIRPLKGLPH